MLIKSSVTETFTVVIYVKMNYSGHLVHGSKQCTRFHAVCTLLGIVHAFIKCVILLCGAGVSMWCACFHAVCTLPGSVHASIHCARFYGLCSLPCIVHAFMKCECFHVMHIQTYLCECTCFHAVCTLLNKLILLNHKLQP
jgi:hypothetical protein